MSKSLLARVTGTVMLLVLALACDRTGAGTADGGGSKLVQGVRSLTPPPTIILDAGLPTAVFATATGQTLWAVSRPGMHDVLLALKTGKGPELANALEKHPAVPAELVARARAVQGHEPLSDPAEAALVGPLSLPFGGVHAPLRLEDAVGGPVAASLTPPCSTTLLSLGATGQLLAGIGRSRPIFLLDKDELSRFAACANAIVPPADLPAPQKAALERLKELMRLGLDKDVAVLLAPGGI